MPALFDPAIFDGAIFDTAAPAAEAEGWGEWIDIRGLIIDQERARPVVAVVVQEAPAQEQSATASMRQRVRAAITQAAGAARSSLTADISMAARNERALWALLSLDRI
jgi:hypothetical protein